VERAVEIRAAEQQENVAAHAACEILMKLLFFLICYQCTKQTFSTN
jgi:hypothetical protein